MKKSCLLGAVCGCAIACIASVTHAALVRIEFSGFVTELRPGSSNPGESLIDPLSNYFTVGQSVSGYYIYDASADGTVTSGDAEHGDHSATYPEALKYSQIQIGTFTAETAGGYATILNNSHTGTPHMDLYRFTGAQNSFTSTMPGSNYLYQYLISLSDTTETALNSVALPQTVIDPTLFDLQESFLNFRGPGNNGEESESLRFSITEMSLYTVPLPPAVWLFGSGLIGLVGIARRKKV